MTDVGRLSEALVAAQAEMPRLVKDEEANTGKFAYRYLSLQGLLEQVLPVLNRHGLALIQMPGVYENQPVLWTHIRHVSGDELKSPMLLPSTAADGAQALGSALTYARRYAVLAFLGLAPDEDEDGVSASGAGSSSARPAPQQAAPGDSRKSSPSVPPSEPAESSPEPPPQPAKATERPPAPGTLSALKQAVEALQKGYPSPDPNHSYWDDVRAYMIGEFAKSSSADLSEAQVVELVLEFERRLIEAGQSAEQPF